jgi:hypothetical protein
MREERPPSAYNLFATVKPEKTEQDGAGSVTTSKGCTTIGHELRNVNKASGRRVSGGKHGDFRQHATRKP